MRTFFITLALAAVTPALAGSTYPGAACEAYSGGTLAFDLNGHIENASTTSTLNLICPITDPNVTSPSTDSVVWVTDMHFSSNVCCDSRVKNTGSSVVVSSQSCSTGTNAAAQSLAPVPPAMAYTFSHRFLYCSVPASYQGSRSELRTYRY